MISSKQLEHSRPVNNFGEAFRKEYARKALNGKWPRRLALWKLRICILCTACGWLGEYWRVDALPNPVFGPGCPSKSLIGQSYLGPPSFIPVLPLCLRASHNQNLQCLQCWQVNFRCTVLSLFPNYSSKDLGVIRSPNKRRYFFLSSRFTWLVNLFDIAKTKTRELLYWKSWRTVTPLSWG